MNNQPSKVSFITPFRISLILVAVLAAVATVALLALYQPGRQSNQVATARPDGHVTICRVAKETPFAETTAYVAEADAEQIIKDTLSYPGPCAEYGGSGQIGAGKFTAYTQTDADKPHAVGMVFPTENLDSLPVDPPNEALWCADRDGNGNVDQRTECAGGYERMMPFGNIAQKSKDFHFNYLLLNWNPEGHVPEGVYDVPHFDVHFYVEPNENRLKIRAGDCPVLTHCDDYALGKKLPDAKYLPDSMKDLDSIEPAMGNHLLDPNNHEFHGQDFTHMFIYGVWDSEITFYEPMITVEWIKSIASGKEPSQCVDYPQPSAWKKAGWYATKYCMEYRENRDELTISLQNFVYRQAS